MTTVAALLDTDVLVLGSGIAGLSYGGYMAG